MAIPRLIADKFITPLPYPTNSYAGRTIVVTGCNIGLGKEAARHYARLGASKLILAVRNLEKGNAAKKDIESTAGVVKDNIEVWQLDLASYDSVLRFANRVNSQLDRLDIFMANAGMAASGFVMAEHDELVVTVNVVSTTLLNLLVLPKLKATAEHENTKTNLCMVSSGAAFHAKFPERNAPDGQIFAALDDESNFDREDRYHVTKLLQLFAMRSICERLPSTNAVVINAVSPGFCNSALGRHRGWGFWLMRQALARSTEFGSRTLVHAGDAGTKTHKTILRNCEVEEERELFRSATGQELQSRVWAELAQKLESIKPGVTAVGNM